MIVNHSKLRFKINGLWKILELERVTVFVPFLIIIFEGHINRMQCLIERMKAVFGNKSFLFTTYHELLLLLKCCLVITSTGILSLKLTKLLYRVNQLGITSIISWCKSKLLIPFNTWNCFYLNIKLHQILCFFNKQKNSIILTPTDIYWFRLARPYCINKKVIWHIFCKICIVYVHCKIR